MYSKEAINSRFKNYISENGGGETLVELLESCEGLVRVAVSSYSEFSPWAEDIRQEVIMRLLVSLRSIERAKSCGLPNPFVYLVGKIRGHLHNVLRIYARKNGICVQLSSREEKILEMRDCEKRSFDEIARELGVSVETAEVYYSLAKGKAESFIQVGLEESFHLLASQSPVGPDVDYELKQMGEIWEERAKAIGSRHPSLSTCARSRRRFQAEIRKLLQEEYHHGG